MEQRNENVKKRISSIFSINKIVPCAITLSALCFGLTAVRFGMLQQLDAAIFCILCAAFFDALDGRAARYLGSSSQFGAELDSLSDLVDFGVAPGLLMYMVALQPIGKLGWLTTLYFIICCALRLARFNVGQINEAHSSAEDKTPAELKVFFCGVPAPAGAIICVLPIVCFLQFGIHIFLNPLLCAVLQIVAGTLMICKTHTFSSKMLKFDQEHFLITLLGILLVVMLLIVETWMTVFALTLLYLVLIPYGEAEYKKRLKQLESEQAR